MTETVRKEWRQIRGNEWAVSLGRKWSEAKCKCCADAMTSQCSAAKCWLWQTVSPNQRVTVHSAPQAHAHREITKMEWLFVPSNGHRTDRTVSRDAVPAILSLSAVRKAVATLDLTTALDRLSLSSYGMFWRLSREQKVHFCHVPLQTWLKWSQSKVHRRTHMT